MAFKLNVHAAEWVPGSGTQNTAPLPPTKQPGLAIDFIAETKNPKVKKRGVFYFSLFFAESCFVLTGTNKSLVQTNKKNNHIFFNGLDIKCSIDTNVL